MTYTTTWLTIVGYDTNLLETESLKYLFRIADENIPYFKKFLTALDLSEGSWPSKGESPVYDLLSKDPETMQFLDLIGDYFPENFEYLKITFNDETHGYKNS